MRGEGRRFCPGILKNVIVLPILLGWAKHVAGLVFCITQPKVGFQ